ncbi:MAG: phosphoserine phosphatase SerB [Pseudomonadota bacterium]
MLISVISPMAPVTARDRAELLRLFDGESPRDLDAGRAFEFVARHFPEETAFEEARAHFGKTGIDLNRLSEGFRQKRMLIADMDSTMIEQECIDEMADHAGIGAHVAKITARAMDGKLGFEEAMLERVSLIKGLPLAALDEVFAERITYMPGGDVLLATMRRSGAHCALVSGGFTFFTERVASALGFDEHRANALLHADGRLSGDVARPILGRDAKVEALEEISARLELSPADAIAVGDGANDLGMLERAGMGVALHAKPSVQAECDIRINHGDLTALLFLQGYSRSEFASRSARN